MTPEEGSQREGIHEYAKIVQPENLDLGFNIEISDFTFINAGRQTIIDDYSCIHSGSKVIGGGELYIGRAVAVTYNCVLITSVPSYESHMSTCVPSNQKEIKEEPIYIKDEAFIGSNSVIMPGVTIGEGAVIGALSYIDEDVPPWTVVYPDGSTAPRKEFDTYD